MHSSTSNSNNPSASDAAWGIRVWLAWVVIALLLLEVAVRFGLPQINSNMRRFHREVSAATSLGHKSKADTRSILFLGNSLTLTDIDMDLMRTELGAGTTVTRWAIDDTNYLDWYFGLKRIFRAGGRPELVVVGGKSGHFLAPHARGQFFSHYILDARDIPEAASRVGADANGSCNMAIAHLSSFYGSREEVYKRTLTWVLPGFRKLARGLNQSHHSPLRDTGVGQRAMDRLSELKTLCAAHGAQLAIWLPPTPNIDPNAKVILEAGGRSNVSILVPIADGAIPSREYSDGFHLSAGGAKTNTVALALALRELLAADHPFVAP